MYLFRAWGSDGGSGHMKYICRSCGICEHEFLRGIRMGAVILENSKFVWPKFLGEEGLPIKRPGAQSLRIQDSECGTLGARVTKLSINVGARAEINLP
jgi:hypothetical protein